MPSFDIVSKVDSQELDNALNQTRKEVEQRYDFKGTRPEVTYDDKTMQIRLECSDETRLKALIDILDGKLVKRGISLLALTYGKPESAGGQRIRQTITVIMNIDKEKGKEIIARVKKLGIKVQAQYIDEQIRVTGKNRDDLQQTIQALKSDPGIAIPLQFTNFRE